MLRISYWRSKDILFAALTGLQVVRGLTWNRSEERGACFIHGASFCGDGNSRPTNGGGVKETWARSLFK